MQNTERTTRVHTMAIRKDGPDGVSVELSHREALALAVDLIRWVNAGVPADFVLRGQLKSMAMPAERQL